VTSNSGREATLASGRIYVAGTADTKSAELAYVQQLIREQDVAAVIVDLSTSGSEGDAEVSPRGGL
jgi:uncharacterized protein (UPF0261 family)